MSLRRIILFIGHHKTGTSSLQDWLARHAPGLVQQGVLSPAVEPEGLAALRVMARSGWHHLPGAADAPLPPNRREAHNALAFAMLVDFNPVHRLPEHHHGLPPVDRMLALIRAQIAEFTPHTLVLASEVMGNFGAVSPMLIDRLLAGLGQAGLGQAGLGQPGLGQLGAETHLDVVLRPVDAHLVSWHAQRLRFGHRLRPLPDALPHYRRSVHLDYRLMLEPWLDRVSHAAIRPHAAQSVAAFLACHGITAPPHARPEARLNRGLHPALIEIARVAGLTLPEEQSRKLLRRLIALTPELDLPPSSDIEMFGITARARLVADFAPVADWLATRAADLGGKTVLPPVEALLVPRPVPECAANAMALAQLPPHLGPGLRRAIRTLPIAPNFADRPEAEAEAEAKPEAGPEAESTAPLAAAPQATQDSEADAA